MLRPQQLNMVSFTKEKKNIAVGGVGVCGGFYREAVRQGRWQKMRRQIAADVERTCHDPDFYGIKLLLFVSDKLQIDEYGHKRI